MQSLEGGLIACLSGLALRADFRNSDVVTSTGIPLLPLPRFTEVRISLNYRCTFSDLGLEMHGREDGTVPATFQIIYMVYTIITPPKRKPNVKDADWVETLPRPTKTSRAGILHEEP